MSLGFCFTRPLILSAVVLSAIAAPANAPPGRVVDAERDQDTTALQSLVAGHADVNVAQGDGATALHWAAHWNDLKAADLLIRSGANVNAADDEGVTPLSLACLNASANMVQKLLDAGADPKLSQRNGETPLMTASMTGDPKIVELLIAHHADLNAAESSLGQTALMRAVAENHPSVVRVLIAAGADVKARSKTEFTTLLFAAQQGNIESAKLLIGAGANVNDTAPDGIAGDTNARLMYKPNTEAGALLVAIDSGHEAMARFLVENGADVDQSGAGRTPLHAAVQHQMTDLVNLLLDRHANPNARLAKPMPLLSRYIGQQAGLDTNVTGATPFWLAAEYGDAAMMRLLASRGADPKLTTVDNTTPLIAAAGVDFIEGQDRYGRRWFQPTTMPLQLEALEATKVALELGNDINAVNKNGQTAMHGAAYMGSVLLIRFLADHGAKLDAQNKLKQTPYYITQGVYQAGSYFVRKEAGDLLKKLGADTQLGSEIPHTAQVVSQ